MKKKFSDKRKCLYCGKEYVAYRAWARFCSPHCRVEYWREQNPRVPLTELEHLRGKK